MVVILPTNLTLLLIIHCIQFPHWLKINGGNSSYRLCCHQVANQNINVSFEAGTYPVGTYQDNIIITSNDPDEGTG